MIGRNFLPVVLVSACVAAPTRADEQYVEFLRTLQERGYHDMAAEYLQQIRKRPALPAEIREIVDLLVGQSLLGGSEALLDLTERDEQLQKARGHFEKFLSQHSQHARAAEAQMSLAQILVARGRVAVLQADNPSNQAQRGEFQQQARGLFDQAKKSFAEARDRFEAAFKSFPPFIPDTEKRQREAKSDANINVMQAKLNLGLVEYEVAQTYDRGSSEEKNTLKQAIDLFEIVRTQYSSLLGGQYAFLWQGKCFEEMAELGKAEGVYEHLLKNEDKSPAMRSLQRHAQFFQIIIFNKRGEHVLAADLAKRWLQENQRERRSEIGLGVLFEQAQALVSTANTLPAKAPERGRMLREATDNLNQVARFDTIYKQPAILLQQKYKGLIGGAAAAMTYDRAVATATAATERGAWSEAADLYTQALKLAKDSTDPEELALTRYMLSFCYYQTKNYYEAAVLGEYVSRRQPQATRAVKAGHVALEAYARAFNDLIEQEKPTEFEAARITSLAEYLMKSWPKTAEADAARIIFAGLLRRTGESSWTDYKVAVTKPVEEREPEKLNELLQKAQESLTRSVELQKLGFKPDGPLPVEFVATQILRAEVALETGQPADAVKIVESVKLPLATQQDLQSLAAPGLVALLRGQVMTSSLPAAMATMNEIEGTGKDLAQITRVYLDLGKQLHAEFDRIKARGDAAAEKRFRDSYIAFLNLMASRREGQTFATLQWTGESFFGLQMYDLAADRFREILSRSINESNFIDKSNPKSRVALLQVRIRLVAALRKQQRFSEAWDLIKPLPKESNPADDPMHKGVVLNYDIITERGLVMQEWGARDPDRLKTAIDHWAYWALQLEKLQPMPTQYFEYRVNMLRCLIDRARHPTDSKDREQRLRQAEQQILFLTKTSNTLGGPTFKPQFKRLQQELEKELGRPIGGTAPNKTAAN